MMAPRPMTSPPGGLGLARSDAILYRCLAVKGRISHRPPRIPSQPCRDGAPVVRVAGLTSADSIECILVGPATDTPNASPILP